MTPLAVGVREAAWALGISPFTVRSYAQQGKIKVTRIGRRVVIPVSELERIAQEGVSASARAAARAGLKSV